MPNESGDDRLMMIQMSRDPTWETWVVPEDELMQRMRDAHFDAQRRSKMGLGRELHRTDFDLIRKLLHPVRAYEGGQTS